MVCDVKLPRIWLRFTLKRTTGPGGGGFNRKLSLPVSAKGAVRDLGTTLLCRDRGAER